MLYNQVLIDAVETESLIFCRDRLSYGGKPCSEWEGGLPTRSCT